MADIGDPAAPLMMDHGLVGRAALQIIVADEPHIALLRFSGRRRSLGGAVLDGTCQHGEKERQH
jgi:hypothetical protein